jgi:hypothetical protein
MASTPMVGHVSGGVGAATLIARLQASWTRLPLPRGIDPPDQVRRPDVERVADPEQGVDRRRLQVSFELADVGAREAGPERVRFLGDSLTFPRFSEIPVSGQGLLSRQSDWSASMTLDLGRRPTCRGRWPGGSRGRSNAPDAPASCPVRDNAHPLLGEDPRPVADLVVQAPGRGTGRLGDLRVEG